MSQGETKTLQQKNFRSEGVQLLCWQLTISDYLGDGGVVLIAEGEALPLYDRVEELFKDDISARIRNRLLKAVVPFGLSQQSS